MQAQLYTTNYGTITITRYLDTTRSVVIPETITGRPVTAIGDFAFYEDTSLPSVTIPSTVTSIGNRAFYGCINLTSVNIPDGVTNIGESAFYYCNKLTTVTIPSSVTGIGSNAFTHCLSLTSVMIPHAVTNIGMSVFDSCTNLTEISVAPDNPAYSSVSGVLFDKSTSTLIECPPGKVGPYSIPTSVTGIGNRAFKGCFVTSVTMPNSVTNIADFAFFGEEGLTSITIPNSVTSIGDNAFGFCPSLTSVTLPKDVAKIRDSTFLSCNRLTNVTIPNSVIGIGDDAFGSCPSLTSIEIPSSVSNIGSGAFAFCYGLTNVTIGASVTNIGWAAFSCCISLTRVYFHGNAPAGDSSVLSCRDVDGRRVPATAYYLSGTTGWGPTFGGVPTALWSLPYPVILNSSLGVRSNGFGFTVSWATNLSVVVEAAADLTNPVWSPAATNALSGGSVYFSDPQRTKSPSRFYRVRSQ